jgi:hypothetical protein
MRGDQKSLLLAGSYPDRLSPNFKLPRRGRAPRNNSAPAYRYTAHSRKTLQSHRTSAQFGLRTSRFAKPFWPACDILSRRRPASRFGLSHSQNRAVLENILICASPPALHPLGQPLVASPTGFPALRFLTSQLRMKPRADLQQRSNPSVDSLTPVRLTLRAAFSSLPRSFPSCLGHLD